MLRAAGRSSLGLAVLLGVGGLVWWLTGFEPAFVLLVAGLAALVLAVGLLAAARTLE